MRRGVGRRLAARVTTLVPAEARPWLPEFARAVFRDNFAGDSEIADPAELRSLLDSLGEPGAEIVERAQTGENKLGPSDQTPRAAMQEIAGAPSFVVDGELFWAMTTSETS